MQTVTKAEKWIHQIYLIFVCVGIVVLVASAIWCKIKLKLPLSHEYRQVSEYQAEWETDLSLPQGGMDVVSFHTNVEQKETNLSFYPIHQSVNVYQNGNLIYSLEPAQENIWGRSPGHDWVSVPLEIGDNEIRIELIPSYESSKGAVPVLFVGNEWAVYLKVLQGELLIFLLAFVAIFVGTAFIVSYIYGRMNAVTSKNLLYLGEFSIIISIWKVTDLQSIDLIAPYRSWLAMLTLLALYFAIIPFTLFMKSMFAVDFTKVFDTICYCSFAFLAFNLIAQVVGFCDFRENLTIGHVMIVIVILLSVGCAVLEMIQKGKTTKILTVVICLLLCFAGTIVDMLIYYSFHATQQFGFGMLAFDICIISFGILTIRSSQKLMEIGKEAGHFQDIAFHDEMTALYSRAAYMDYIHSEDFRLQDVTVFMFDLNNLKKCNDTYGHEAGDAYLTQSAKLIKDNFASLGKCFRMGGDEFCCVIERQISEEKGLALIDQLQKAEQEYMKQNPDVFPVQIAAGFASYHAKEDYDISDTLRRADKMMYANKHALKMQAAE